MYGAVAYGTAAYGSTTAAAPAVQPSLSQPLVRIVAYVEPPGLDDVPVGRSFRIRLVVLNLTTGAAVDVTALSLLMSPVPTGYVLQSIVASLVSATPIVRDNPGAYHFDTTLPAPGRWSCTVTALNPLLAGTQQFELNAYTVV